MTLMIKWLFSKVPKKVVNMVLLMDIFGILSSLIISYSTILSKNVINYAISMDNKYFFNSLMLIFAVLSSHILYTLAGGFVSFTKGRYLKYLGEYCYKKIMNKKFVDFSKKSPAFYSEVSLRTTEDLLSSISDYDNAGGFVFVFKIAFYLITIYILDHISGLSMIIFVILLLLSLWLSNIYYYKREKIIKDQFLEVKSYVADMFKGKEEIQLFNAHDFEMKLFQKRTEHFWKFKKRVYLIDDILSLLSRDFISTVFYLFIIYRGIILGNIGTFYALLNLFTLIKYQLYFSMGIWDNVRSSIISAKQLEEIVG